MVGNHLKRQAGVADASYKAGTIEIKSEPARAFQIGSLLRVLKEEFGFGPIKRIDATIRGRVVTAGASHVLKVAGTEEELAFESAGGGAPSTQQLHKGAIEIGPGGQLTLKAAAAAR